MHPIEMLEAEAVAIAVAIMGVVYIREGNYE